MVEFRGRDKAVKVSLATEHGSRIRENVDADFLCMKDKFSVSLRHDKKQVILGLRKWVQSRGDAVTLMTALMNFNALFDELLIFLVYGVELLLLDLDANGLELRKGSSMDALGVSIVI